jgi:LytS/YehU family sensor histidine kinase
MPQEISLMSEDKTKENVIKQKEVLAQESLKVANEAIGLLQDQMSECSTRDLVQIFSAAVKAHREITDDIVVLTTKKETPSEESLAREYDGKVEELLKRIKNY